MVDTVMKTRSASVVRGSIKCRKRAHIQVWAPFISINNSKMRPIGTIFDGIAVNADGDLQLAEAAVAIAHDVLGAQTHHVKIENFTQQ